MDPGISGPQTSGHCKILFLGSFRLMENRILFYNKVDILVVQPKNSRNVKNFSGQQKVQRISTSIKFNNLQELSHRNKIYFTKHFLS